MTETEWAHFFVKDLICCKNIMIFGINSAIVLKKNLILNKNTKVQ